jgi:hypothetical protein
MVGDIMKYGRYNNRSGIKGDITVWALCSGAVGVEKNTTGRLPLCLVPFV